MIYQLLDRFPGISCARMDAAGQVTTEYYGVSDRETRAPVDEHTIFPAFSMSKFVTAICLMKLHEEKIIDIDAPVNTRLKTWKLLTPKGRESDATIRALLHHTAGIEDAEDSFYGLRRGDPEISLTDILEGRTPYHNRPVRAQKPQGTAFAYSDAGYCVLQLLVQDVTGMAFEDAVQEILFSRLGLQSTFFGSAKNLAYYENSSPMATGYDGSGMPIPGKFLPCPDLAGAGLWSTPKEMLTIGREFLAALGGRSELLQEASAIAMATAAESFPWAGLGVFLQEGNVLMTQGWGESGQCMMKMNCRTGEISVVMTNRNPETDQSESGVEWLVNRQLTSV